MSTTLYGVTVLFQCKGISYREMLDVVYTDSICKPVYVGALHTNRASENRKETNTPPLTIPTASI
jgi:hypothetical protein